MASMDHKARARASVRNGPKSKWHDGTLYPLSPEQEQRQSYVSRLAGMSLAVTVIEGMLKTHERFMDEQPPAQRHQLLPFNPVQRNGLSAAIYFLNQYIDQLDPDARR
jgi:hypothetical protein